MSVIDNLFNMASPLKPLQVHMDKVTECVDMLKELYQVFVSKDENQLEVTVKKISDLEHSADLTKNDIRHNLPKGLFMAIKRETLLDLLAMQDKFADNAEDIGVLMTLKKLSKNKVLEEKIEYLLNKSIEAVHEVKSIIFELDNLVNAAFTGKQAKMVKQMISDVAYREHEIDIFQRDILRTIFSMEEELSYTEFRLWLKIIDKISTLSDIAENLAYRVDTLLETGN